jgi:hypothetical protein
MSKRPLTSRQRCREEVTVVGKMNANGCDKVKKVATLLRIGRVFPINYILLN